MCVIMVKKAGVEIPYNLLESACIVNPHGFGVAIADRGQLYIEKMYREEGNSPEPIAKALEELKEHQIYLHLRYKTSGNLGEANCHPFEVLNMKEDGMQMILFHNGTLFEYKDDNDKTKSDTHCFVEQFVTPLYRRIFQTCNEEEMLNDPLAAVIMEKFVGLSSKVLLVDNYGNDLIINKTKGKEFDWGWASNDYSFNRTHREPTTSSFWNARSQYNNTTYYKDGTRTYWDAKKNKYITEVIDTPPKKEYTKPVITPDTPPTFPPVKEENKQWYPAPKARATLEEMEYIDKIEEVCYLSEDDFSFLIKHYPEMATALFLDMQYYIHEVWEEYGTKDEDEEYEILAEEESELKEINNDLNGQKKESLTEDDTPWTEMVSDNMNDPKTREAIDRAINLPAIWGQQEECSLCGRMQDFCQCDSFSNEVH